MSLTPIEACQTMVKAAVYRHKAGYVDAFFKGVMGGVLLSLGGMVALMIGGGIGPINAVNPGLTKLISAAVFPIGIISVILTGTDLVTANMATFIMATMKRRLPLWAYPANITVVFFGNLCGSLFTAQVLAASSGIFTGAYAEWVITFATAKVVTPSWSQVLLRGFGCNFLVCLAVYQAVLSKDILSKIVAIELPIFLFVALGYDHVVANMLFIPLAIMLGAPQLTGGLYVWKSLIPSFIGNMLGAVILAVPMSYFHLLPLIELERLEEGSAPTSSTSSEKDLTRVTVLPVDR